MGQVVETKQGLKENMQLVREQSYLGKIASDLGRQVVLHVHAHGAHYMYVKMRRRGVESIPTMCPGSELTLCQGAEGCVLLLRGSGEVHAFARFVLAVS
jgi:hypothetical protein